MESRGRKKNLVLPDRTGPARAGPQEGAGEGEGGHERLALLLIRALTGIDATGSDIFGRPPLCAACAEGHDEVQRARWAASE